MDNIPWTKLTSPTFHTLLTAVLALHRQQHQGGFLFGIVCSPSDVEHYVVSYYGHPMAAKAQHSALPDP